ncbi:hypothetical protein Taro_037068 [Colocasia esculenta]|uniref:Oxidative stress 3 n=1 Tax=Colocasia esculenta TaxID=4460 RepID=A0A843WA50_COLES|nr:hypothetical protein [Colocasia esculenta]
MEASTIPRIACGIMAEEDDELGCPSSSSSGDSTNSNGSSEFMDDATSPSTSSSSSSSSTSSPGLEHQQETALDEMSSLMAQLPFKRGLSKHFQGKSQSFTSLSSVRCLEDLAKPDRPYKKKLKPCKSYGGGLDAHTHKPCSPRACCSRAISKKPSRGARQGFLGSSRPPVPPNRSGNFSAQTLLFA